MVSYVYISTAAFAFTESQLKELLKISRENNQRNGLTGMLAYKTRYFVQVLEGEELKIDALTEKIRRDPRHFGMVSLRAC